jgi:hypothetical protein
MAMQMGYCLHKAGQGLLCWKLRHTQYVISHLDGFGSDRQIVLYPDSDHNSKFYSPGNPLFWGVRLTLSFRPEMDLISQPRSYIPSGCGALNLTRYCSSRAPSLVVEAPPLVVEAPPLVVEASPLVVEASLLVVEAPLLVVVAPPLVVEAAVGVRHP